MISKLRKDARLLRIYKGAQKARGRKRIFDKSGIKDTDFEESELIILNDGTKLESTIAFSVSLKRKVKIVRIHKKISAKKQVQAYLFSTDLDMEMMQIYKFYVARFQIEFLFRDAKNFTGLTDCQSRDKKRMHYHFNASLLSLNVAKLEDAKKQQKQKTQHSFSMSNWARKYHVQIVTNRFISMLGFDLTCIKLHPNYEKVLELGRINH